MSTRGFSGRSRMSKKNYPTVKITIDLEVCGEDYVSHSRDLIANGLDGIARKVLDGESKGHEYKGEGALTGQWNIRSLGISKKQPTMKSEIVDANNLNEGSNRVESRALKKSEDIPDDYEKRVKDLQKQHGAITDPPKHSRQHKWPKLASAWYAMMTNRGRRK